MLRRDTDVRRAANAAKKINNRLPVTLACGRSYVGIFCRKDISGISLYKRGKGGEGGGTTFWEQKPPSQTG